MSTTIFERGDVVLVNYPMNDDLRMHHRPAMILHNVDSSDIAVSVLPITPDPVEFRPSIYLAQGSFEAARLGIVTNGYLNASSEVVINRHFIAKKIGRCPWRLLSKCVEIQRHARRDPIGVVDEQFVPKEASLIRAE